MKQSVALTVVLTIWSLVVVGTIQAQSRRTPVRLEGALIFEAPQAIQRPGLRPADFKQPAVVDSSIAPVDVRQNLKLMLEAELQKKLRFVDHACTLTEEQKGKLLLAGKGDIYRLVDQIAESGSGHGPDDREGLVHFYIPEACWSVVESRPSDDGTLFAKTSRTVLTAEQFVTYQQLVAPRQQPAADNETQQALVVNPRYVDARAAAGLLDNVFVDRGLRTSVRSQNVLMIFGTKAQLDNCVKLLQRVEDGRRGRDQLLR